MIAGSAGLGWNTPKGDFLKEFDLHLNLTRRGPRLMRITIEKT